MFKQFIMQKWGDSLLIKKKGKLNVFYMLT